jgi:tRNA threonylcarbamoyladenosine biosynthesis protein TsaE
VAHSTGPDATRALGERLGAAAAPGDLFLLEGSFGTGKTVLVQGLARGLGVEDDVSSPSFVLVHQHHGRLPFFHVDLYRLQQIDPELEETVWDAVESGGVTAIEWPGLLPTELFERATILRLRDKSGTVREIDVETPHRRLAAAAGVKPVAAGD